MERNNLKWFIKKLKVIFKYIIAFELYFRKKSGRSY